MADAHPLRFVSRTDTGVDRRSFLKLLSASALAAGAAGCAGPTGEIVPYVTQPPEVVPGVPLRFATAMELDGYGTGLIVESREGRPIKVEGNPAHPASLGASSAFQQAAIYELYDPDRPQYLRHRTTPAAWVDIEAAFAGGELQRVAGARGNGLVFLLEPTASPMVLALVDRVLERFPGAAVAWYAPLVTSFAADGSSLVLGEPREPMLDPGRADVIVTLDADLLGEGPFHLRYARQFADRRRVRTESDAMNRLYAVEGAFTPTGMAADHRLMLRPGEVRDLAASLLQAVLSATGAQDLARLASPGALATSAHADWVAAVARDLAEHRGRALVIAGPRQPAIVHALAAAINDGLGGTGTTVSYATPVVRRGGPSATQLASAMVNGDVRAAVILSGNPAYNAPADANFAQALSRVPLTLYAGSHQNETARAASWFVPLAHFLESWGDARALDGTASIVQPLISPIHGGRSVVDLLAFFAGDDRPSYDLVHEFWLGADRFDGQADRWREALRRGVVPDSAEPVPPSRVDWRALGTALARETPTEAPTLEIALVPDASVHDGRFANNAWLQELPDPVTKLTWDNAAYVSSRTLDALGVRHSDVIEIAANGRRLRAPAFLSPGVADGLIVLPLGYGREGNGQTAAGVGVNGYALKVGDRFMAGAAAAPVVTLGSRDTHEFAVTEVHWSLDGRPIVLEATLDQLRADPHFTEENNGSVVALYPTATGEGRQWGMAIDLSVCTGCSACVIACQAENNVPVVGKAGVQERREMHWLRIDRYLTNDGPEPRVNVQPMLCQHCEDAPCEYVCPVNATVHSPDGLNEMVYNRCVGTRFCSNNCPYKVRRFNYLNYTQDLPETEQMAMNPDVTVRDRGIMEKCTFCVQRIRRTEIDAQIAGTDAPYNSLETACQQACPTRAIVFGSIADPDAQVSQDRRAVQAYRVLNELGTRPRVTYLARLRNANPAMTGGAA